jgi:demethylmenaquinone methyltransferase/2-methoxy-6-polyprenyl-1,4-benzoquinol methylase
MGADELDRLLDEQVAYYRARAPEYEAGVLELPGGGELDAAIEAAAPAGRVLELACGPGTWTARLARDAELLTAVDASPEMLARAAERIEHDPRVTFVHADLFTWEPDREYDFVFFGFWLSHVPLERFEAFWGLVRACLGPGGRVLFVDDAYRTPDELIEGEASSVVRRELQDGSAYRAVKVPHTPAELEVRIAALGWTATVRPTAGPFFWGAATPAAPGDQP